MSRAPILCYHRIADLSSQDELWPYSVSPRAFARQVAFLAGRGYQAVPLSLTAQDKGNRSQRTVMLTFDDGYLDVIHEVWPVLRRYRYQATIFLVSEWLLHLSPRAPAPVLSLSQAVELQRSGLSVGAHGRTHCALDELPKAVLQEEIVGAKRDLESAMGVPIKAFAYPYGLSSTRAQYMVRAAGYEIAVAVRNGTDGLFDLRREVIGPRDGLLGFAWKLWQGSRRTRRQLNRSRFRLLYGRSARS